MVDVDVNVRKALEVIFFTPKVDNLDPLFGHSIDWIQSFCPRVDKLSVYAVHVSKSTSLDDKNLSVFEIGGGSLVIRIKAILLLLKVSLRIAFSGGKNKLVIYHMAKEPALVLGPLLKIFKVRQVLWYSHSASSKSLRFVHYFINEVYTPTVVSYPICDKKVKVSGHGIDSSKFCITNPQVRNIHNIVSLGRISRIKHLERIIQVFPTDSITLEFIGRIMDEEYKLELETIARARKINIHIKGEVAYKDIPSIFRRASICYTGSPKTLDKAAVQAAMCGCFVISEETEALESLGMAGFWNRLGFMSIPALEQQLKEILKLDSVTMERERKAISSFTREKHDLNRLIELILDSK
jgi:glycosyltransferase involved in cell wall biosynthesis